MRFGELGLGSLLGERHTRNWSAGGVYILFTYTYLHMRGEEERTDGPSYYSITMGSEAVRSSIR